MRRHPHLYEINTWPWLAQISARYGRRLTLGTVPDEVWDGLRARGIDLVYLMGIWTRSAYGRRIARSDPGAWAAYDAASDHWHIPDVVGSAFCISGYEPDPHLGTMADLDRAREAIHARGMRLVVDFIPNHFGFDHPWTTSHPYRFVCGSEQDFRDGPTSFRLVEVEGNEPRYVARARDPYFLPWSDVAQIDYSKADTRLAMIGELQAIARHADGVRCDMAMLVLSDVFSGTWKKYVKPWTPEREFWADARDAVPDLLLIGEVYWDMEWRLQQLGFDYTYDKRLYRLLHESAGTVAGHLRADRAYQEKSARFVENHDEPRSAQAFGRRAMAAACAAATISGLRFFYDGQFEGRRIRLPMQLGFDVDELVNEPLSHFYDQLLTAIDDPVFHDGEWTLCDVEPVEGEPTDVLAWRWTTSGAARLVVVNVGSACSRGRVVDAALFGAGQVALEPLLTGQPAVMALQERESPGLLVQVPAGAAQIFTVRPGADRAR